MSRPFSSVLATANVVLMLSACSDPAALPRAPEIVEVAVDSSLGPLIRTALVRLDAPGNVVVVWGANGTPVLSLESAEPAVEHRFVLPRLRPLRNYTLEARTVGTAPSPRVVSFGTGPLPPNLAALVFSATGDPTWPVSIVEFVGGGYLGVVFVEDGEIVWYHPTTGSLFGSTRRANADIVLLDPQRGLVSISPDGVQAHRLPQPDSSPGAPYGRIHHDVIATPANTILFIANETRSVRGEMVVGEALWEWTPETGAVQRRWSAFDHLDFAVDRGTRSNAGNWLHGNGLAYGPRGNVLLSMRNADLVASIAPDFSRIEWKLGGQNGTLAVRPEDRFYGQHYVSEPSAGRVLVYDNGFERPGGAYTRVVEYAIDTVQRQAAIVWQYRRTPEVYASLVGSARRLPNGNTVILYGMTPGEADSSGPLMAIEIDPAGRELWRLTPPAQATRLYRVTPVESVLGERASVFTGR